MNPNSIETSGKVAIEEMEFYAFHGVHPVEQKIGRNFLVSVYFTISLDQAAINDDLEATIDYGEVYQLVKREMAITERLLETLCRRMAWKLKNRYDACTFLEVRVGKMAPFVGGKSKCAWVSYSLENV